MIEESFVRLYAHDFVHFAARAEMGQDVELGLTRRLADARSHGALMDARKGSGHLPALITRLRDEGSRFTGRAVMKGVDPVQAAKRHQAFLKLVADRLADPGEGDAAGATPPVRSSRRPARSDLPTRYPGEKDAG